MTYGTNPATRQSPGRKFSACYWPSVHHVKRPLESSFHADMRWWSRENRPTRPLDKVAEEEHRMARITTV